MTELIVPEPGTVIGGTFGGIAVERDRRKDRLLRIRSVVARTGLSVATIYRREMQGTFPKRERIGPRCVGWYESDIDDFVAAPFNYRSR